jgi:hypothetical protein
MLLSVGHVNGHPTATWSLPPAVQPKVIEIATNPMQGSDGAFFIENVKLFETLNDGQTTFLSSSTVLMPGIYYVHVSGFDEPCFFAGACPIREWSNILTLTIPNTAPRIQSLRWNAYQYARSGSATLQVCDEGGALRIVIRQARLHRSRVVARATSLATDTHFGGCAPSFVTWQIPRKLIRPGDVYRMTFTVVDQFRAASRPKSVQTRWRH